MVIDEHGTIEGIVTLADLVRAIIGDLRSSEESAPLRIVQRKDNSWLADGSIPIPDLLEVLSWRVMPGEEEGFNTLGGFVLAHLHRIPSAGDHFTIDGWKFEVVDMDGNRVDKVLISPADSPEES